MCDFEVGALADEAGGIPAASRRAMFPNGNTDDTQL
jgi:hypothetical protein